jgi:hypothetical protein
MDTQHATQTEPKTGALRRAARALARASERLQAYRPAWPPAWLADLGDYLTTSLAGVLRVVAALLVVV